MRPVTSLLLLLFSHHQPLSEARSVTADVLLEVIECRLDEGLSSLDDKKPGLARKQIAVVKEFGSVTNMVQEAMKDRRGTHPAITARMGRSAVQRLLKG